MSAPSNGRSALEVRGEIERERQQLATALETLRGEIGRATDVTARLRERAARRRGAFAAGFVCGRPGATSTSWRAGGAGPPEPRGRLAFLRRA